MIACIIATAATMPVNIVWVGQVVVEVNWEVRIAHLKHAVQKLMGSAPKHKCGDEEQMLILFFCV